MAEKVIAYSLGVVPTVFDRTSRSHFYGGGTESKHLVLGADNRSYIERLYDIRWINNWKAMRKAGLPVVPDILLNPMRRFMLLTDIKADGSEAYGKALSRCLEYPSIIPRDRPRPDIDQLFLNLTTPENLPKIKQAVDKLVATANTSNIELPKDDAVELVIHPDGSWGLMTLDLQYAKTLTPQTQAEIDARRSSNITSTARFLRHIKIIRQCLTTPNER